MESLGFFYTATVFNGTDKHDPVSPVTLFLRYSALEKTNDETKTEESSIIF